MIYVYLHGFNSAYDPNSSKIQNLASLGDVIGITYDSFGTYKDIFQQISHEIYTQIHDNDELVFVGTSLGGFWASEMGRFFGVPSVIINPCRSPYDMLRQYVNKTSTNYITGETNVLTDEVVDTYPMYGIARTDRKFNFLPLILLDMADEVIDSKITMDIFDDYPMVSWEGGSHRFDHMEESITHIQQYVNLCSFVNHMD